MPQVCSNAFSSLLIVTGVLSYTSAPIAISTG